MKKSSILKKKRTFLFIATGSLKKGAFGTVSIINIDRDFSGVS